MANAKRDFIVEKVKEVLAAPSCCPELKDAAQKYLAALDTADEKAAGKILIAELEEDVAANMAETARKVKATGAKICFCPACTAGKAILDHKETLL